MPLARTINLVGEGGGGMGDPAPDENISAYPISLRKWNLLLMRKKILDTPLLVRCIYHPLYLNFMFASLNFVQNK